LHLSTRQPPGGGVDDLELGDRALADAFDLAQPGGGRGDDLGEGAELGDQRFGQRLDVALRNGAEHHQFEQFVIADRLGAGLAETRAQALAVTVVMRRGLRETDPLRASPCRPCPPWPPRPPAPPITTMSVVHAGAHGESGLRWRA
jgi:hypothetical protein